MGKPGTILIAGIAEGFGIALAETFAKAGFDVLGLARSERVAEVARQSVTVAGRHYQHIRADLRQDDETKRVLAPHAGDISVAIVIAQRFFRAPFLETCHEDFTEAFATNCAGAATVGRVLLPAMLEKGQGTLIFTGATASLRGGATFSALAASKFALRALAQSLAREFGPRGIHVAHLVIDGPIDTPQTDARFPGGSGPRLDPMSLAKTCLMLARQTPDTFTHELDLRPAGERF
jgi:NAD(P)-dependent dehydrogenase (short-subunit alcohol dehydrogenase family)